MGLSIAVACQTVLFIVPLAVVVIVVIVAVAVIIMAVAMLVVMAVSMSIVMVVAGFVFAVVIAVVVVVLFVELVAVELLLPAVMVIPIGMFAADGIRTVISEPWIVMGINVSVKAHGTMEPRPGAKKHATRKPLRAVIAKRCALVRRVIEIAVRTNRRHSNSNVDADLRGCRGVCASQANNSKNRDGQKPGQFHNFLLAGDCLQQFTGQSAVLNLRVCDRSLESHVCKLGHVWIAASGVFVGGVALRIALPF